VTGPYRYCPYCRAELQTRRIPSPEGPERRVCGACGFVHWGNSRPTAAAILLDAEDRLLLGRRAIAPFRGWWDIPGGFLEPGEHPEDGVRREMREETGLEVAVERLVGDYMDTYGEGSDIHTLNFYYQCRVLGGQPSADDDVEALAWFSVDALPAEIAFPSAQQALRDWLAQKEYRTIAGK
jgi:8-oxo-dGTP diphosphatase